QSSRMVHAEPCRRADRTLREKRHQRQRSEEHTSELQSHLNLVCRLLLVQSVGAGYWVASGPRDGHDYARAHHVLHGICDSSGTVSFSRFFNDTATTEIYTLSLHGALPI